MCFEITISKNFRSKFYVFIILLSFITKGVYSKWTIRDFAKREHSLVKPYHGSGLTVPNWDLIGSTIITDAYVRLTPDLQGKTGALWNSVPCDVNYWELQVQFKVHGTGKLYGDGFAIWYTREKMKEGTVFGSKDYFEGLAIFIDTYTNHNSQNHHRHPYISSMVNNGTLHYDHDRDGTHTELAGCQVNLRNSPFETHIFVRYTGNTLAVLTDLEDEAEMRTCLSVDGVELPSGYHFGFSAITGDLSDNHDILSVRLYEMDSYNPFDAIKDRSKIIPSAKYFSPPRKRIEDTRGLRWSGLKIFLIVGILICALTVGGVWFRGYQKAQRHRTFY